MNDGLLEDLISQHIQTDKSFRTDDSKSYFREEPRRFLPPSNAYPHSKPGIGGFITEILAGRDNAGVYNGFNDQISIFDQGPYADPSQQLDTYVHEYGHWKNQRDWPAKKKSIMELFGNDSRAYKQFIEDVEQRIGVRGNIGWRGYLPGVRENEVSSYLQGKMVGGHVNRKDFENELTKMHPRAVDWFNIISSPSHFRSSGQR